MLVNHFMCKIFLLDVYTVCFSHLLHAHTTPKYKQKLEFVQNEKKKQEENKTGILFVCVFFNALIEAVQFVHD